MFLPFSDSYLELVHCSRSANGASQVFIFTYGFVKEINLVRLHLSVTIFCPKTRSLL